MLGCLFAGAVGAQTNATITLASAQAVRSDWSANAPPVDGWETVTIPDIWTTHWPTFDGVVWYRLEWDQADGSQPVGLALQYLNMAGEVSVNGTLLHRDLNLVDPLTRAWNTPRFWVLAPPVLRSGKNELLVRVSGLAAYQPGLGPITVGPVASVQAMHEWEVFLRHDSKVFGIAIAATLGSFFLVLWLMRRREVAFGWYGVSMLVWFVYTYNQIATSTWPFTRTEPYQTASTCLVLLFSVLNVIFVIRFCDRRFPRFERALWLLIAASMIGLLLTPHESMALHRGLLTLLACLVIILAAAVLIVFAWRGKQVDQRILSLTSFIYIPAAVHDMLAFTGVLRSNFYFSDISTTITTVAVACVLGWRYSRSLQRIENFNNELRGEVNAARDELAINLRQQHDTEMAHARIGERLSLVRDIHDGLGGTLMGSIAAIENAPQNASAPYLLGLLKELRDDLRLIIDSSAHQAESDSNLGEQLIPIRHRMSRLLDALDIACVWDIDGIDTLKLPPTRALDVLRFLQEALTNVMKHSGATIVNVKVRRDNAALQLEVADNGRGLGVEAGHGAGMKSMQSRALRLGGQLRVDSSPGKTVVAIVRLQV